MTPFIPVTTPILIGAGFLLSPKATKNFHRMWPFPSVLLLTIVMNLSKNLSTIIKLAPSIPSWKREVFIKGTEDH
jgi:hypothetical protein